MLPSLLRKPELLLVLLVPPLKSVPLLLLVPERIESSDWRCMFEFMLPEVVLSRELVLGSWPCIVPEFWPWSGYRSVVVVLLGVLGEVVWANAMVAAPATASALAEAINSRDAFIRWILGS